MQPSISGVFCTTLAMPPASGSQNLIMVMALMLSVQSIWKVAAQRSLVRGYSFLYGCIHIKSVSGDQLVLLGLSGVAVEL